MKRDVLRDVSIIGLVAAVPLLGACGGDDGTSSGVEGATSTVAEPFVAFERDFQSFRRWETFPLGDRPAMGVVHLAGMRTDFVNHRPPKGASSFPVGTIVVKEIGSAANPDTHQIFAMVKRGGGYNMQGAVGWEWFELQPRAEGGVTIVWRGTGPPNGEVYGSEKVGTCNDCHGTAATNDYVLAPPLSLQTLTGAPPRAADAGGGD